MIADMVIYLDPLEPRPKCSRDDSNTMYLPVWAAEIPKFPISVNKATWGSDEFIPVWDLHAVLN